MIDKNLTINEAEIELKDGKFGKLAVFMYAGDKDPRAMLDWAVNKYVDGSNVPYIELIDAQLNCPWVRVIVSNVNDMEQMEFGVYMKQLNRERKIDKILKDV
jgi:hypothetical protein